MRCWGVVLREFQHCFGFRLHRNFLCPPLRAYVEKALSPPSIWPTRMCSRRENGLRERGSALTATRHRPIYEIRGFGPIFFLLSTRRNVRHSESRRVFPHGMFTYISVSHYIASICSRFPYNSRCRVKERDESSPSREILSKNYLSQMFAYHARLCITCGKILD